MTMIGEITTAQKGSFAPFPGNGLGLAIVKTIAEGRGGAVTLESELGKGSCFSFSLPLFQTEIVTTSIHTSKTPDVSKNRS